MVRGKPFQKGHKINVGKHWKMSKEARKKISERQKGEKNHNFGKPMSEEQKNKISLAHKGKPKSAEHKRKISEAKKTNPVKYWLGKKRSEESKIKISKAKMGVKLSEETKKKISEANKGEKCYLWKGGISFEPYSVDWTRTLRRSIRERDRYTCQICGKEPSVHCHHIDYNKKNCNSDNLITLCRSCHTKTNQNREYWIDYFKNL